MPLKGWVVWEIRGAAEKNVSCTDPHLAAVSGIYKDSDHRWLRFACGRGEPCGHVPGATPGPGWGKGRRQWSLGDWKVRRRLL
jgi:hypothetical protein